MTVGLPPLDGRRGRVARAAGWLLLLAAAMQLVGSSWFNARDMFVNIPAAMSFGFKTYTLQDHAVIREVHDSAALASGLADDATFVAIDGVAVPPRATEFAIGARLSSDADGRIRLVARGADGRVRTHDLVRDRAVWSIVEARSGLPLWLYAGFTWLVFQIPLAVQVGVAFLLLRRRPHDPVAVLIAAALSLLCFSNGPSFWLVAQFGMPVRWHEALFLFGLYLLLVAMAAFPDGRFTGWLARAAALVAVAGTALVALGLVVPPAPVDRLLDVTGAGAALLAIAALVTRYRALPRGAARQQVKWAMFGFVVGIAMLLAAFLGGRLGLLGSFKGPAPYIAGYTLSNLGQAMGPLGLLVSLLHYRLYDADVAISRSAIFAALTLSLVVVFTASEKLVEALGQEYLGGNLGTVAGGVAAALAATLIAPLHHRIAGWAEHRFQRGLIELREGLPRRVADLRETSTPAELGEAVVARIAAAISTRRVALVAGTDPVALRATDAAAVAAWLANRPRGDAPICDRDDPLFPLALPLAADGVPAIGWLLLGPRPDGSFYGPDERAALMAVTDPVARALAITLRRDRQETLVAAERRSLAERIAALEARVAGLVRPGDPASAR